MKGRGEVFSTAAADINCLAAGALQCGNAVESNGSEWNGIERTSHANKQSVCWFGLEVIFGMHGSHIFSIEG